MTAIAYRDGIIASDSMVTHEGIKNMEPKIWKTKGHLFGMSGSCPSNDDATEWWLKGLGKNVRPEFHPTKEDYKFDLMVITPKGKIQSWNHLGKLYPIKAEFWAIGGGADVCMGAMEMGASAQEAVKAACKWSSYCGGRVQVKSL